MSYDISLHDDDGQILTVRHHEGEGGTYAIGGSDAADLNITYNYGECYKLVFDNYSGLRDLLDGKRASDVLPILTRAVDRLGTRRYQDYWAPTPGNAGYALNILLDWARERPDAIFRVS